MNRRIFLRSTVAAGVAAAIPGSAACGTRSNEPQAVVNENYRGNFERLLKVKQQYDPKNLFRLNANIATG